MQKLSDYADLAHQTVGRYKVSFILSPEQMQIIPDAVKNLHWQSIQYGPGEKDKLPKRRGVYAFVVCQENAMLPSNGYVMYVGIAGRRSNRTLRVRYKEYLNEKSVLKRAHIARMIGDWHSVLRFYYAAVDDEITTEELEDLEKQISDALIPPFSRGDLSVKVKRARNAFP